MIENARHILKEIFGYTSFRLQQENIISSVLAGKDTLAIMPTGGGKSLCYQIPALMFEGLTIVISPLISLMKDQVEQLRADGVGCALLNSSLSSDDYRINMSLVARGDAKLLYVAPETLNTPRIKEFLSGIKISCLTVDEAHCISEWGHEFRPEYRLLKEFRQQHPAAVCIALTATATPQVRQDIVRNLGIEGAQEYLSSFDRTNLFIDINPKDKPKRQIVEYLKNRREESGIIYCNSRKATEDIANHLADYGYSIRPYHAGLSDDDRHETQELFIRDEVQIIAATVAFGMGINKPNVRFVVHYDLPKNMEGYYQQIGRAGRDGLDSHCQLLFSYGDIHKIKFMNRNLSGHEAMLAQKQLNTLIQFAEAEECRRNPLLEYFGETPAEPNCGMCDNCLSADQPVIDFTVPAQKFLSCVKRCEERFGASHIINVLRGSESEKVMQFGHNQLTTYGIGKDQSKQEWGFLSRLLQRKGHLELGDHNTLKLTESAWQVLKGELTVKGRLDIAENAKPAAAKKAKKKKGREELSSIEEQEMFEELRTLRKTLADEDNVPPYIVFGDKVLIEMVKLKPKNEDEMLEVSGIGQKKLETYGIHFLEKLREISRR